MVRHLDILGGGPAGLSVAYFANKRGIPFRLFEKSSALGGLCRTFECGAHQYDAGAHRFHDRDREVTAEVKSLLGGDLFPVSRPSKVLMNGKFVNFPPTPLEVAGSAGIKRIGRIGIDLLRSRIRKRNLKTFRDFVDQTFGKTLGEMFLINYSEKVWGLPAEQLSPDVATRRLSGMTLQTLLMEILQPSRKTAHLDGRFLYPRGGYGRIVAALEAALPRSAIRIGSEVERLHAEDGRIRAVEFAGGRLETVRGTVVSTIPLTILAQSLKDSLPAGVLEAAGNLRFRHVRLLYLKLAQSSLTENASIYVPDRAFFFTRIYEPRNRCPTMAPPGETGVTVECPCFPEEPQARWSESRLAERVIEDLATLRLVDPKKVIGWECRFLPNAYPVYALDYRRQVQKVLDACGAFENLELLGRNGVFLYSHLHDQLRFARDYAAMA